MAPIIADHWERASFPFEIVPKLRKLNLGAHLLRCLHECIHARFVSSHHGRVR